MQKLLLATSNEAKVKEYLALLRGVPYELTTPIQEGLKTDLKETGATLEENAALKAQGWVAISGLLSLADDSGLEVEALGGEPGPLSARYAGEGATDRMRVDYLLYRLKDVPWEKRLATFRCVIALARLQGKVALCQGQCSGFIALEPKGQYGFGYDPIFYLPSLGKTLAQLPLHLKNQVSHRGQAARKARELLKGLGGGTSLL